MDTLEDKAADVANEIYETAVAGGRADGIKIALIEFANQIKRDCGVVFLDMD